MKRREVIGTMRTRRATGKVAVDMIADKQIYSMPNPKLPAQVDRSTKQATSERTETGGDIKTTFHTESKATSKDIIRKEQGVRLPDPPSFTRSSNRGRRAKIELLAKRRHPKIPNFVYVRSEDRSTVSNVSEPLSTSPHPGANARLESEDSFGFGFDIDASTISASPSKHSLSKDIDESCLKSFGDVSKTKTAHERPDENMEAAGCAPLGREHHKLNPEAPAFVPHREAKTRSSPCGPLARVFCRPSAAYEQVAEVSSETLLPMAARAPSHCPPPLFSRPFPFMPSVGRNSGPSRSPKVTIISEELKILVVDLLTEEECDWILHYTDQHVANATVLGRESWRKIFTHTQMDLPCCEVLPLRFLTNALMMQIRQIVGKTFNARRAANRLVPRSWKEPHLLRYQKIPGQSEHSGMIMHHDGGDLTWQAMLSSHGVDYDGGGTYFRALRKTIILRKGQVLVHPGNLYHRGVDITSGIRTLMVCFMDGFDLGFDKDPSRSDDHCLEYERYVITV